MNTTTQKNILVPWDFSPSSNYALEHAIKIAKIRNYTVSLVHIIQHHKDEKKYQSQLEEIAHEAQNKSKIPVNVLIQNGEVYSTISELAALHDTELIIMKTDGISGMQKYTGSRAIKIMRGSKTPFIVVQQPPTNELFDKIVYPVDYRTENKEVASMIVNISKSYPVKVFIFKGYSSDKSFKKNIANNLSFARMMFESKQMDFEVFEAGNDMDYSTGVNHYAYKIGADLIMIQLQRNLTLSKFIFGVKEQNIIANPYKIPVMCINPKEVRVYAGFR